jgi:hypothetical protein
VLFDELLGGVENSPTTLTAALLLWWPEIQLWAPLSERIQVTS